MTTRVGVIGTGFGARVVAPVYDATPGVEVADVVSARDDAGVATLCDRDDLDLVSVHSPPFLHAVHVRRALVNGHAVLCDKPFGIDATQSEALLGAAEAAEVLHFVNFEFRYDPMRVQLRSMIAEGVIGTPEHVTWTHVSAGTRVPMRQHGWLFDRARGGGFVGAWGSHAIDTLRVVFGEVTDAVGACRTAITERLDRAGTSQVCDAEDGFSAWLTLSGPVSVTIDATFAATASMAPRIVVIGSEGVLESIGDARITVRRLDGTREEHERPRTDDDPHLAPMRGLAAAVRDALESGEPPPGIPTFADGLACARVLDRIRP